MGSDSPEQHEYNVFLMTIMPCSKKPPETHQKVEVSLAAADVL